MNTKQTPVIGFAGWSGSGKTTLIEKLIPALKEEARKCGIPAFRVAVIKHDAHGIKLTPVKPAEASEGTAPEFTDTEGKDSWRFRKAGADSVILSGPEGIFISCGGVNCGNMYMKQIPAGQRTEGDQPGAALQELPDAAFQELPDMDLILVEGFKNGSFTQIGVARKENGKGLTAEPERFLAVVTDDPESRKRCGDAVPVFGFEQARALAVFLFQNAVLTTDVVC